MSISYHGVVGHKRPVTLPSVETWGSNMNILRDPPKSIQTRKIDKVTQDSKITQMIQESGDRVGEMIKVFPWGMNPMVAVSFDNYGNNAGRGNRVSTTSYNNNGLGTTLVSGNIGPPRAQSFLPYRIMREGAFRPPARDLRSELPLSRQPRVWTSSYTQPGFPDFSRKALSFDPNKEQRGVKNSERMLKACVNPTATYKIETPLTETYEVRNVIKNPVTVSANSGLNPQARFNGEIGRQTRIIEEPLRPEYYVGQSGESGFEKNIDLSGFNTEKYTHEILQGEFGTNVSGNYQMTSIEELFEGFDAGKNIRNSTTFDYTVPQGREQYDAHSGLDAQRNFDRNIPEYDVQTNKGQTIHAQPYNDQTPERIFVSNRPAVSMTTERDFIQRNTEENREFNLRPTVSAGEFNPSTFVPRYTHENYGDNPEFNLAGSLDTNRVRMRQNVYDMQQDRNTIVANIPYVPFMQGGGYSEN